MDPNTTSEDMGKLISSDPSITVKILKVVNSPYYGFPSRITTISHAIVILGFNTVKSIVMSVSVFSSFNTTGSEGGLNLEKFWEHSISVGACTEVMAKTSGFSAPEEFFICGLLHDVGKIIFLQNLEEEYAAVIAEAKTRKIPLRQAEEELLGFTHADVGAYLLDQWKLSKTFVAAVRFHHNPALAGDEAKLAAIVHVGDVLARCLCLGNGGDPYVPAIAESAWDILKMDEAQLPSILEACWERAEKSSIYLDFL
jgi:putative nucleotidyltransferase with HDIG domain